MTLAPPKVRQAKRTLADYRKAQRKARPAPVVPAAPEQRKVRRHDRAFLAFLRSQPCAVRPGIHHGLKITPIACFGGIEAAHIRFGRPGEPNAGLQRKPDDSRAVPLCRGHHRDGPDAQHRANERAWWAAHGVDPHQLADELYARFKAQ